MMSDVAMIDRSGYRLNVGIVVINQQGKVLWAKRAKSIDAWQFPQGGICQGEATIDAMYRELHEELGLTKKDVTCLAQTKEWLRYDLPPQFQRRGSKPLCIGQKQKWFLLQLISDDSHVVLDKAYPVEFDRWCWVDYWYPVEHVIAFKRDVYQKMLTEFRSIVEGITAQ